MRDSVPLVSIGVPTYNRPEGLARTLDCLVAQTYSNIQILVSDNASPDPRVSAVGEQYARNDPRITYYRHAINQGAALNFKYVLRQAHGEYFMWAADDDEWGSRFVEACMSAIGNCSASCVHIGLVRRPEGHRESLPTPQLDPARGAFVNAVNFLETLRSSLFYGVHRRSSIEKILEEEFFDYYDCFVILRQILTNGFVVVPEVLYWAGIEGESYIPKPHRPSQTKVFTYLPFLRASSKLIATTESLSLKEKTHLLKELLRCAAREFSQHEREAQPVRAHFAAAAVRVAAELERRFHFLAESAAKRPEKRI